MPVTVIKRIGNMQLKWEIMSLTKPQFRANPLEESLDNIFSYIPYMTGPRHGAAHSLEIVVVTEPKTAFCQHRYQAGRLPVVVGLHFTHVHWATSPYPFVGVFFRVYEIHDPCRCVQTTHSHLSNSKLSISTG